MPDGPPSPENETSTGLVYQPFASGPRERLPETDGGLESLWTVTDAVVVPAGYVTVHVSTAPLVSSATVVDPHPLVPV